MKHHNPPTPFGLRRTKLTEAQEGQDRKRKLESKERGNVMQR